MGEKGQNDRLLPPSEYLSTFAACLGQIILSFKLTLLILVGSKKYIANISSSLLA